MGYGTFIYQTYRYLINPSRLEIFDFKSHVNKEARAHRADRVLAALHCDARRARASHATTTGK